MGLYFVSLIQYICALRYTTLPTAALMCMGTHPYFSVVFTKGDNFSNFLFFAGWRSPSKKGSTVEGKNLLQKKQILSSKVDLPHSLGRPNENGRAASPERVPIHLNHMFLGISNENYNKYGCK